MKRIFLSFAMLLSVTMLFACKSKDEEMKTLGEIASISVSKSDGFGGMNEDFFRTIDEDAKITGFEEVLKNAKGDKRKAKVDQEKPDYDILIRYENGDTQGLHLILGNKGKKSIMMFVGHESNSFDTRPEDTKFLKDIVDN